MSSAKKNQTTNGSCSQSIINRVFILFTWTHYHQYIQGHLFEESCGFLNHSFSLDNDLLSRKCGYIFFLFLLCIHCFYRFDIFIFNRGLSNGIHCDFSYFNQSRNLCFFVYQIVPVTLVESVVLLLVRSDDKSWRRYSVTIVTWWRP